MMGQDAEMTEVNEEKEGREETTEVEGPLGTTTTEMIDMKTISREAEITVTIEGKREKIGLKGEMVMIKAIAKEDKEMKKGIDAHQEKREKDKGEKMSQRKEPQRNNTEENRGGMEMKEMKEEFLKKVDILKL
jgi:hypothetical protein